MYPVFEEMCPYCDYINGGSFAEISTQNNGKKTMVCKNCGKTILLCNLCEDCFNCGNCKIE